MTALIDTSQSFAHLALMIFGWWTALSFLLALVVGPVLRDLSETG